MKQFYSTIGRPSIDPELTMRMLIVGYRMGIVSRSPHLEPALSHLAVDLELGSTLCGCVILCVQRVVKKSELC